MESAFWFKRWQDNDIAFHEGKPNSSMTSHFSALSLPQGSRVFLPLCGKTQDIQWLLTNGYQVVGSELVKQAIDQLFSQLEMTPEISTIDDLLHYRAKNIDIYVGDIFNLSSQILAQVDAIYDRAALVALPEDMRRFYTAHLMHITEKAPQLLISYEYDQSHMNGPPFSLSREEIAQHYQADYDLALISSQPVAGKLKGLCEAMENVWLLRKKQLIS